MSKVKSLPVYYVMRFDRKATTEYAASLGISFEDAVKYVTRNIPSVNKKYITEASILDAHSDLPPRIYNILNIRTVSNFIY